jgi:hypothetical protein
VCACARQRGCWRARLPAEAWRCESGVRHTRSLTPPLPPKQHTCTHHHTRRA